MNLSKSYSVTIAAIIFGFSTSALANPLRIDQDGTIFVTTANSKMKVTRAGEVEVNKYSARCGSGLGKFSSPSGDVIKCAGDTIKIIDHFGNTLKIAGGDIIKLETSTGESFTQSRSGAISAEESVADQSEQYGNKKAKQIEVEEDATSLKNKNGSIDINERGVNLGNKNGGISITEKGVSIGGN